MPRALGDRPLVVPRGSVNLAFIGNYAETDRDTVFTTEYSVRTAMQAVYTLLNIDRGVPEVFDSCFDIRMLLQSIYYLNDGKKLQQLDVPWIMKLLETGHETRSWHIPGTVVAQCEIDIEKRGERPVNFYLCNTNNPAGVRGGGVLFLT